MVNISRRTKVLTQRQLLWKQVKALNLQGSTTGYAKSTVDSLKAVLQSRIIKNPVTGLPMDAHTKSVFESLGYKMINNKFTLPRFYSNLNPIKTLQGTTIYPLSSKQLKRFHTGLLIYTVNGKNHAEAFNIRDRDSATRKANDIIYSNNNVIINKIHLYTAPKLEHTLIGPAYRSIYGKNCVISALEQQLKKSFPELHELYSDGVFQDDYESIAKALKIQIRLNIGNEKKVFNAQGKYKMIDLIYLNNHVVAKYGGDFDATTEETVIQHNTLDLAQILSGRVDQITEIIESGSDLVCIKLITQSDNLMTYIESHQLTHQKFDKKLVEIQGISITAVSEFKHLVIRANNLRPITWGMNDAQHFARHGIKVVNMFENGKTIDLKGAYTNYMQWPCYEGIPFDITFWINGDQTPSERECILNNYLGFGLVSNWRNHFTDAIECRWAFIPHIKARIAKGQNLIIERWALSFAKGDLDLSMFKDMPKRLWHQVLGSMSRTHIRSTGATTDPVWAKSKGGHEWRVIDGKKIYKTYFEPRECNTYVHVAAAIHSYTEMMMEAKYDQLIADGIIPWSVYVDGISTNTSLTKYVDQFWQEKANNKLFETFGDSSYTEAPLLDKDLMARSKTDEDWGDLYHEHQDRWAPRKFVDIMVNGPGAHKVIDGPAGSGKSTLVKKISAMIPKPMILVPNNNQRAIYDGLKCMTIDMYLTQFKEPRVPFLLIDEYTMLDPTKLEQFGSTLLIGNVAQLKIGAYLDYKDFDHHLLTKVYRCNPELEKAASLAKEGKFNQFTRLNIVDALKAGKVILAATHDLIEDINDIGLKLNLPKRIRFTKTDLKRDIFAGDMGYYRNNLCVNDRNGRSYKATPGRNPKKDSVVYGFARTYHATQGLEFNSIVCCIDKIRDWDMLYTGCTRVHNLNEVHITSLRDKF